MKKNNFQDIILIWVVSLFSSFLIALFFYLFPPAVLEKHVPHGSNEVLERNYDGPIYVVLAKTLYNPKQLTKIGFNKLPVSYFANHFPLLPIIIRLFSSITNNYFRSMISINWLSAALFSTIFYLFLKRFKISNNPLLLSLASLFIPPRWLAVRAVGGTEPLFLLILIISLYLWFDKKFILSSLFAVLLVLIRPPGIVFFFSFLAIIIFEYQKAKDKKSYLIKIIKEKWLLLLMPLSLLGLFFFFQSIFGNFWAYFQSGTGTNVHLKPIPFAPVLNFNTPVVEGFLYLLVIYLLGIYLLWQQKQKQLALFSLIYLIPNFFMVVDDIHRYLIPIAPFCLIIGYQKIIKHKAFKYFFFLFLIGTCIYTLSLLPNRMFHYGDYASLRVLP